MRLFSSVTQTSQVLTDTFYQVIILHLYYTTGLMKLLSKCKWVKIKVSTTELIYQTFIHAGYKLNNVVNDSNYLKNI